VVTLPIGNGRRARIPSRVGHQGFCHQATAQSTLAMGAVMPFVER